MGMVIWVGKVPPRSWVFEHLVPSWLHCFSLAKGIASQLMDFENFGSHPIWVYSLCFVLKVQNVSFHHFALAAMDSYPSATVSLKKFFYSFSYSWYFLLCQQKNNKYSRVSVISWLNNYIFCLTVQNKRLSPFSSMLLKTRLHYSMAKWHSTMCITTFSLSNHHLMKPQVISISWLL